MVSIKVTQKLWISTILPTAVDTIVLQILSNKTIFFNFLFIVYVYFLTCYGYKILAVQ